MKLFLILMVGLLLTGCASLQEEPVGYSQGNFWQAQGKRRLQLNKFAGKLYLSYKSEKQNGAGKGQIIASIPRKMRMELRDPFGRLHYVAVLNGKRFVAHFPRVKKFFEDKESGRSYLRMMVGFDRSFSRFLPLLLGTIPKEMGSRFASWEWDGRKGLYRGVMRDREVEWRIYVDPKRSTIAKIHGESPFTEFELDYDRFERCCGGTSVSRRGSRFFLAKSVELSEPKTGHKMGVEWRGINRVKKDFPRKAFSFAPPKGTQRIN